MQYEFTREELEQLAALAHLQADTMAEGGRVEQSRSTARLAERLEWALAEVCQEAGRAALLLV